MCTSVIWVDFTAATALTAIGAEAFQGMTSLHRVDMSGATQLANLGANAFNGCIALTTAKLASSITVIGAETFTSTLLSTAAAVNFNTVDCVAATSGGAVVFIFVCPLQLKWTEGAGGGTVWSARQTHAAVCFDDGVVVTTGGSPGGSEVHTTTAGGSALSSVSQTTFTTRKGHAIARVPGNADAFLVVGGIDLGTSKNDALLTEDRGVSFVEKSNSVFTSGRYGTALVATGPATFVAYGGYGSGICYNEVRQSTNSGVDWTTLRAEGGGGGECSGDAAMWSVRGYIAYAFMPLRNRILLAGGYGSSPTFKQDVWGSDDGGTCWIQLTADSDGTATMDYNSFWAASLVVATLGDIEILVLAAGEWFGGDGRLSSVYRSIDAGVSWDVIPSSGSMWPARSYSALVYNLANTRLAISGGEISGGSVVNDFWTADATYLFPKVRHFT